MLYVLINGELAHKLKLNEIRTGDKKSGYVVTTSDLATYGAERAISEGAVLLTNKEAQSWIYNFKNNWL